MSIRSLILALTVLGPTTAFSQVLSCEKRTALFHREVNQSHPLKEKLAHLFPGTTKVLVLGEDHGDYLGKDRLPEFYRSLKKARPELNCLFLELGSDQQKHLDAYLAGQIDATEFSRRVLFPSDQAPSPERRRRIDTYARIFTSLLATAEVTLRHKGKVFAVDSTVAENGHISARGLDNTNERNAIMARNISAAFAAGSCRAGVKIVGLFHILLRSRHRIEDKLTLQANLGRRGVPAKAFIFSSNLFFSTSAFYFEKYAFEFPDDVDEDDPATRRAEAEFNAKEEACFQRALAAVPKHSFVSLVRTPDLLPAYELSPVRLRYATTYPRRDHLDGWIWFR